MKAIPSCQWVILRDNILAKAYIICTNQIKARIVLQIKVEQAKKADEQIKVTELEPHRIHRWATDMPSKILE